MNISSIEKYDSEKLYKVYDDWPEIASRSFASNQKVIDFNKVKHIVFAGMGGSGTISNIFASILSKKNIHVDVVKGYNLPETANEKTLVIVTSVSGNTSEAYSILKLSKKRGCKIIAFSSGGKIEKYCKKNFIEYRKIQLIHSPRASLTAYLYSMLKILLPIIPISTKEINKSIKNLEILSKNINSKNISKNNQSIQLAQWISETPVIYYPSGLQAASIRFKNSLQENAKMHVISEDVIEACHNGIVPWEREKKKKVILIQGTKDNLKTRERWRVLKKFFKKSKIEYFEIKAIDGSILEKLIYLIYMLDYASIYKAVITKIDPSPVKPIDFIKKEIKN